MPVRFGLSVPNCGVVIGAGNPKDLVAMCEPPTPRLFDAVFTGDNLISKPRLDAIVSVAGGGPHPARDPRHRAHGELRVPPPDRARQQWRALDLLSDGRTLLVACIGGGPDAPWPALAERGEVGDGVRRHGRAEAERVGRMVEGMAILRALWDGRDRTHTAASTGSQDVRIHVTPVQ